MNFENNWHQKTLENLEKEYWDDADHGDTGLVKRCFELRKIPLEQFTIEDLRLMIGQKFSPDYLIPLALEVLQNDLFAEGNLFPGDLLKTCLTLPTDFWDNNKNHWTTLNNLIQNKRSKILEYKFDITKFDKCRHAEKENKRT